MGHGSDAAALSAFQSTSVYPHPGWPHNQGGAILPIPQVRTESLRGEWPTLSGKGRQEPHRLGLEDAVKECGLC